MMVPRWLPPGMVAGEHAARRRASVSRYRAWIDERFAAKESWKSRASIIFGFTLKVLSHKPKWGVMWRKASHKTINDEMWRMESGARSWKSNS